MSQNSHGKVVQFHLHDYGIYTLLFEDGSMAQCEVHHKENNEIHLVKVADIILPA